MDYTIFYQLSLVMAIAAGLAIVARALRQPLIIAYIIAGIIAGPSVLHAISDPAAFNSFSQIGIALLLFIIGLGLNIGVIKDTGKPVVLAFLGAVVGVGTITIGTSRAFGFTMQESLIVALALLFSSTIIAMKSLSDKREQNRLHGQLAIGILLVEDLAATIALLVISANGVGTSGSTLGDIGTMVMKGGVLTGLLVISGGYSMPRLGKVFAANQELLYIFAIAWAFGIASLFRIADFSLEVGALAAGVSLASLPYSQAISTKLKPLRDFFLVLFFIELGEKLELGGIGTALLPALALSAIAIFIKPLMITAVLGFLGYTKQISFKTSLYLSQISEFSIILLALAATSDLLDHPELTTIMTVTALITFTVSSYLSKYDDALYRLLEKPLGVFERASTKRERTALRHYPLVLLGYREGGYSFVQTFRQMKKPYIVIDFDPDIIERLEHQHINHMYGDATDIELLTELGIHRSDLVISTIEDVHTNKLLARHISEANAEAIFICHAQNLNDTQSLYEAGAAYVLTPHHIGDEHINAFLQRHGHDKHAFAKYRKDHLLSLGTLAVK